MQTGSSSGQPAERLFFLRTVEAAKTGTDLMNAWMKVICQMERAVCQRGLPCAGRCNDAPTISAWDQAAAFHAGSMEGENSDERGNLLCNLADQMCMAFCACGKNGAEQVVEGPICDSFIVCIRKFAVAEKT
jgi:hypothetical protein